jgi:plasmid stabilization system protein ParE
MPRAERDLLDIYDWTGASSSDTALTWYRGLKDAIRSLSNKSRPLPGDAGRQQPPAPALRPQAACLHVYRVIYRVIERQKQVDVLHVRHGARQEFKNGDLL